MKNRIFSMLAGILITIMISGFAGIYVYKQNSKRAFQRQSAYMDIVESADRRFNDLKHKFSAKKNPADNVFLVAIDDAAITEVGRWPWSRDIVAELMQKLFDHDVKALGLDIVFSEPQLEKPENDQALAKIVAEHTGKVILGAYSDNLLKLPAYQDYCVNEAFLFKGGEHIVKINPSFVVDDTSEYENTTESFDVLNWAHFFNPIFKALGTETESLYLSELKKNNLQDLSQFQKNSLAAQKTKRIFDYCAEWLTPRDSYSITNNKNMSKMYAELFASREDFKTLSVEQKIEKFLALVRYDLPVPQYGYWHGNILSIQEPAKYTGSFVTSLDLDGYVRRYPTFYRSGNKLGSSFIPSLALQTYLAATGYRADIKVEKIKNKKEITAFEIKDPSKDPEVLVQELPVDHLGQLLVNFYGPQNTLPYISAKDLFSEDDELTVYRYFKNNDYGRISLTPEKVSKKKFLKGKSAIVGVTAMSVYDLRNTPVDPNFPGPEIHLTVLSNLFNQQFIKHLPNEVYLLPAFLLVLGVLMSVALSFSSASLSVMGMLACLGAIFWLDKFVFDNFHIMFSSVFAMIEIPLITFSVLAWKYSHEERKKNEMRKMFSKYVSPAVVDELLKSDENMKLGGRKQDMSVFFSDVRGFTEFSEKMDPQVLSQFLNEYLTPMTEIVFNNKGTLDKYMGDGLMAFFGAPVPFKDHAYHACKCALQSMENLKKLQVEFEKRQWPKIDIGIGINSGFMSVGNMGSKIVQSYTVIGDAVNLGSRLESANKEYGTHILVSESTYAAVKDQFVLREVDLVRVKGKKEPIKAYELIAEKADSTMLEWLNDYDKAYTHYLQQHFEVAKNLFTKIETAYPFDRVSKMYIERCQEYIDNPPLSHWDGVYEMKAK